MDVVSTAYRPAIKIIYNKLLKETKNLADTMLNLADLIEVKGMKAQGNQVTKLKVKEIVLTHPIDESPEPWPVDEEEIVSFEELELDSNEEADNDDTNPASSSDDYNDKSGPTIEWDFTKKEGDEDQMTLF